jgi:hypothetical protein
MRTSTRVLLASLAIVVIATAGGSSGDRRPRLIVPGLDPGNYASWLWERGGYDVGAHEPFTDSGLIRLCLDRPGRVRIVDVSLEYSVNGLQVDAFGVKPVDEPGPRGASEQHRLWQHGFDLRSVEVDRVCPDNPAEGSHQVALGLQFSKPTDATARAANLLIDYVSLGQTSTLRLMVELVLCEGNGSEPEWAEQCQSWTDIDRFRQAADGG